MAARNRALAAPGIPFACALTAGAPRPARGGSAVLSRAAATRSGVTAPSPGEGRIGLFRRPRGDRAASAILRAGQGKATTVVMIHVAVLLAPPAGQSIVVGAAALCAGLAAVI